MKNFIFAFLIILALISGCAQQVQTQEAATAAIVTTTTTTTVLPAGYDYLDEAFEELKQAEQLGR